MEQYCKEKKTRKNQAGICKLSLILSLIVIISAAFVGCTAQNDFDIMCVYLDAGQGDSSLIMTSEGYTVMIDAGAPGKSDNIVASALSYGVERIDLLILTHFHEDHVAGASEVMEQFDVKELWCLEGAESYITKSIENAAKISKTKVVYADQGDSITLGESVSLELTVLCAYAEGDKNDDNENSLIVKAEYLDFSALFMADAGHKTEKYLLENQRQAISCDILKVGHHGSDSSSCEDFIKAADPQIAVISCEKNNPYGHPHKSTLDILDTYCEQTVYTYNGNFEVWVKSAEISFEKKY